MSKSERDICRMKLLVVDDDYDVNRMLCAMLSKNYPTQCILSAHGADAALKLTNEVQPDIFLVDVIMPVSDGITLSQKLISENKERTIIHMSVESDYDLISRCYASGAKYYIRKPIDFSRLFSKLDSLMIDLFYKRFNHSRYACRPR